jgi:predicted metal-dependent hydrolase
MNLEYSVVYSARKTLTITVERDRSVIIRAPHDTPPEKIEQLIHQKKLWIYEKVRHTQKYDSPIKQKEFVSGTTILYLGKSYKLEVVSDLFDGVLFDNKFLISKSSVGDAPELFKNWYIEKAKQKIVPQSKFYATHLGVRFNRILISDLKYRWGSCTPSDSLNFNWRLIKAPIRAIDYVIVHELAHLLEPNHTSKFWGIIKSQLPDYLRAKEWLKNNGNLLDEHP